MPHVHSLVLGIHNGVHSDNFFGFLKTQKLASFNYEEVDPRDDNSPNCDYDKRKELDTDEGAAFLATPEDTFVRNEKS